MTVSIEWEPAGCGHAYFSDKDAYRYHGSDHCGRISVPLEIYLNSDERPAWQWDPDHDPTFEEGKRTD